MFHAAKVGTARARSKNKNPNRSERGCVENQPQPHGREVVCGFTVTAEFFNVLRLVLAHTVARQS
jgi:hypothetical protein